MKRRSLRMAWILPPAAFIWAVLMTVATNWNIVIGLVFALIAIPLGRWIDRESYQHDRY